MKARSGTGRENRCLYRNDEKYWVGDFPKAFLNIVMKALTES